MKIYLQLLCFLFCVTSIAQENDFSQLMVTYENYEQDTTYLSVVLFAQEKYIQVSYKPYKEKEHWTVFDKVTGKTKTIWYVGEKKSKMVYKLYEEEDQISPEYTIEYDTTDRREILGIDCYKATIEDKGFNTIYHLYVSPELSDEPFHPLHKMFPELKGFPLSIENNGKQRTAMKVSKRVEPDYLNALNEEDALIVIDLADIKEVMGQKPDSILMSEYIFEYLQKKY